MFKTESCTHAPPVAPLAAPQLQTPLAASCGALRRVKRWVPALLVLILLPGVLTMPGMAQARGNDRSQPVDVQADRSEFDEQRGVQTLIGNVRISQGSMRISASRIEVFLSNNQLARIRGEGSPIVFEQENDAGENIRGEAESIEFDAATGVLILSGGATLSQPRQQLSSEQIVFDSRNQKVSAEGGSSGRVNIRIEPPSGGLDALQSGTGTPDGDAKP